MLQEIRNRFIYLEKTKTNERRERGLSSQYVFTYHNMNVQRIDRAFQAALKRAGVRDFRFHDLRHTFASHLAMEGATQKDLQALLGHKTMSMTQR